MSAKKARPPAQPTVVYSYVGNIGCIRFPVPIRKASGIKRGDRLAITLLGPGSVRLDRLEPAAEETQAVAVEGCACASPPPACANGAPPTATVGWSYVQLGEALAFELGFLPDSPIRLIGEPARITVALHEQADDLLGVPHAICPP
ncbi:MAG TPA: AbrB/MazE/SpoVT family DNA-binding domain-containing protein [Roseiflexaceae bacterium]|nr:AbrB/MazE/SpoVT family DNA-binding domain-containing protein [Roseiflexaceae bacterium]